MFTNLDAPSGQFVAGKNMQGVRRMPKAGWLTRAGDKKEREYNEAVTGNEKCKGEMRNGHLQLWHPRGAGLKYEMLNSWKLNI